MGLPGWMTAVWALGVFGAFLASLLLLLRRKLALPVFIVSLAAFLVSLLYTYVLTNGGAVMGPQMALMSAVIAGLLVLFAVYAWRMGLKGVLRQGGRRASASPSRRATAVSRSACAPSVGGARSRPRP